MGSRAVGRIGVPTAAPRTGYAVAILGGGLHGLATALALATRHGIHDVAVLGADGTVGEDAPGLLRFDSHAMPMLDLYRTARRRWRRMPGLGRAWLRRRTNGHITLAHGEDSAHGLRFQAHLAGASGMARRFLDRTDLRRHYPQLNFMEGTRLAVSEGILQPDADCLAVETVVRATARAVIARGIDILAGVRPIRLRVDAGRVVGIATSHGVVHADRVILAAPATTVRLAAAAGLALPLAVQRVDRVTTMPVAAWLVPAVASHDLAIELWQSPTGHMHLMGSDVAARAMALFPCIAAASVAGIRSVCAETTPDGMPLLGPAALDGLLLDAGWGGAAVWSAPVAAEILADAVVSGHLPKHAAAFAPDRFPDRMPSRQAA